MATTQEQVVKATLAAFLQPLTERDETLKFLFIEIVTEKRIETVELAIAAYKAVILALMAEFPDAGYQDWYPGDRETKAGKLWPSVEKELVKAKTPATGRD